MAFTIDPAETRQALIAVSDWVHAWVRAHYPDRAAEGGRNDVEKQLQQAELTRPAPERAGAQRPSRAALAKAVRLSARMLAQEAPGHSVEVRVPPFVAVQCIDGPRHTRGTPPNVVEMAPEVWLALASGYLLFDDVTNEIDASGTRAAEVAKYLPVCRLETPAGA